MQKIFDISFLKLNTNVVFNMVLRTVPSEKIFIYTAF